MITKLKTAIIKQIAQEFNANFVKINTSNITEPAELIGFPVREHYVCKQDPENPENDDCTWVASELLEAYAKMGYKLTSETRMGYAIPAWLKEFKEGEMNILLIDDWTRSSNCVINCLYDIIYQQEYISWKLPSNTHICLSANPDNGSYTVTSIDEAAASRMVTFNVKFDVNSWSEWAEYQGLEGRTINFMLANGMELMDRSITKEAKVNARNYTMFANIISGIPDWSDPKNLALILQIAAGCFLDEDGIVGGMFTTFIANKLDKLLSPEDLVHKDWAYVKGVLDKQLYDNDNYRADIASIVTTRFVNYSLKHLEQKGNSVDPISDRILKIVDNDKQLLSEDLLFNLIKTLNKKFPGRCNKLILNPKIAKRLM